MGKSIRKWCKTVPLLTVVFFLFSYQTVYSKAIDARRSAKSTIFGSATSVLKKAEALKADLFSPQAFQDGMEYYKDAEEAYEKGKDLEGIEEDLEKAMRYFEKAAETSGHASEFFSKTKQSRDDASNVDAVKYEYRTWKEADDYFKKAIIRYENGDLKKARIDAKEAETLYRKAELETIKTSHLSNVRKDIEKLDDMGSSNNAKKIFNKAVKLEKKASQELERKRYSNEKAVELVKEAAYEIKHALYVHNLITKMENADFTYEDVIIQSERSFTRILNELDVEPRFDKGIGEVDRNIVDEIKKLKFKNSQNETLIASLKDEVSNLKTQVAQASDAKEKLKRQRLAAEEALKLQKLKQAETKKKIKGIRASFSHEEGKVLLDGDNIVIRLYGLNFPSGKSVIEPAYFGLLSKVKRSFNTFRNCEIVIEGHTDSLGSDRINQELSEDRAEAVKQYILANSSIDPVKINAIGYGETKPVASNETSTGQAKNRRIDVVIIPHDS